MSALFFNQLKHLQMQNEALKRAYDELAERVLQLEAEKEQKGDELDVDTLQPKRRGRPPKVKNEVV